MLKKLLYKEFALALHPAAVIFLLLSAMLLIPNYPMYVVFFYNMLGIYFICLSGRENHDFAYTLSLPVSKSSVVTARILFAVLLQMAQLLLAFGFMLLRNALSIGQNAAGMEVNAAFFGLSLILLGLFNLIFFTGYFSSPDKVGRIFIRVSIMTFFYIAIIEACVFTVPFFRDKLDTPSPLFMAEKLIVLGIGVIVYIVLTYASLCISRARFERLDM